VQNGAGRQRQAAAAQAKTIVSSVSENVKTSSIDRSPGKFLSVLESKSMPAAWPGNHAVRTACLAETFAFCAAPGERIRILQRSRQVSMSILKARSDAAPR